MIDTVYTGFTEVMPVKAQDYSVSLKTEAEQVSFQSLLSEKIYGASNSEESVFKNGSFTEDTAVFTENEAVLDELQPLLRGLLEQLQADDEEQAYAEVLKKLLKLIDEITGDDVDYRSAMMMMADLIAGAAGINLNSQNATETETAAITAVTASAQSNRVSAQISEENGASQTGIHLREHSQGQAEVQSAAEEENTEYIGEEQTDEYLAQVQITERGTIQVSADVPVQTAERGTDQNAALTTEHETVQTVTQTTEHETVQTVTQTTEHSGADSTAELLQATGNETLTVDFERNLKEIDADDIQITQETENVTQSAANEIAVETSGETGRSTTAVVSQTEVNTDTVKSTITEIVTEKQSETAAAVYGEFDVNVKNKSENSLKTDDAAKKLFDGLMEIAKEKPSLFNRETETEFVFNYSDELTAVKNSGRSLHNLNNLKNKPEEFTQILKAIKGENAEETAESHDTANISVQFQNDISLVESNLNKAIGKTAEEMPKPAETQLADVISAKIKTLDTGETEFEMTLAPESLGRINVKLVTENGKVSVAVTAERRETAELLQSRADSLAQNLRQSGAELERYTVYQEQGQEAYYNQDGRQGSRGRERENGSPDENESESGEENGLSFSELINAV